MQAVKDVQTETIVKHNFSAITLTVEKKKKDCLERGEMGTRRLLEGVASDTSFPEGDLAKFFKMCTAPVHCNLSSKNLPLENNHK